jgi:HEAT repeat protein
MALKKSKKQNVQIRIFDEFLEAQKAFEDENNEEELRLSALSYVIEHKEIFYVLRILSEIFKENNLESHIYMDYAFANFKHKPKREEDFDMMFKMLKSDNAYLRSLVISFLQEYDIEAKPFIEKLMDNPDKDIRIFAINILGDVKYDDSIDMLRFFMLKEDDVNAMMTAVDYLGEIGNKSDIPLLEALKVQHEDEPYVAFGVDVAIEKLKG